MNTDTSLITFKAITNFTNNLSEIFSDEQHSLKLYCHLINKTTLAHDKAIKKHIKAFREFCISNRESITTKNSKKLNLTKVEYSCNVYINFEYIFDISDRDTQKNIWEHLLVISALVDPAGKAKELLKKSPCNETDFLSEIISKVDNIDPDSNPMDVISNMVQDGTLTDLIGGMSKGLQDGSLDLTKLLGTVQNVVSDLDTGGTKEDKEFDMSGIVGMLGPMLSSLSAGDGENGGGEGLANMLGPMLSSLSAGEGKSGDGEGLANMLGPMLSSLSEGEGLSSMLGGMSSIRDSKTIEEKVNEQVRLSKR
jgi:hypothetical protein